SPISRSDSTLRGHYPAELEPLVDLLPQPPDGHLIIPAYPEAGRIVFDGCHFVYDHSSGGYLPVTETDFSKDPTFGFSHYRLSEWVEEKSKGAWKASQVLSVPLRMLRDGGPEEVSSLLLRAEHNVPIVVDTVTDPDLVVLSAALLRAENAGKRFLCRTAAPFVRSRLGELPGAILYPSIIGCGPGLVLVGSYVQRTSEQLAEARALTNVDSIELLVDQLFEDAEAERHLAGVVGAIESSLASRRTALVFTGRGLVSQRGQLNHVQISAVISEALSSIPAKLSKPPTWLVAKGGITSNDVLTKGLKAKRARVLGQVASGVSALKLGPESTSPGLPFIVFPGNVGGPATLADLITMLSKGR
ncbi:MAG: hydroxyacid dehydrogenase, partial [Verrucomicrobia bacterium]|nr:hydroxyacid dehydrogenase [Verrucomicrobiota bacterium]